MKSKLKPRTPRHHRKAYSSSSSSVSNSSLKKEINFLKRNQEIMRKAFNKLNNDMKEIKKLLKDIENNNSIPSGMYL